MKIYRKFLGNEEFDYYDFYSFFEIKMGDQENSGKVLDTSEYNREQFPLLADSKKIDIFQHLRLNMKEPKGKCKNNNETMYCIPCKESVCECCNYEEHKNHILISKTKFDLSEKSIDDIYNQIESALTSEKVFVDYKPVQNDLIDQVNQLIEKLQDMIEKLKDIKVKEIQKMFNGFSGNVNNLKSRIEKSRAELKTYLNKNKKFFNLKENDSQPSSPQTKKGGSASKKKEPQVKSVNKDDTNSLFLINYELLNIAQNRGKEILSASHQIARCVEEFKQNQKESFETMLSNAQNIFFGDVNNERNEELDHIIDETLPSHPFTEAVEELNKKDFNEITNRVNHYNALFDKFKKSVFDSITKYGNLKEIENYINTFEASRKGDSESNLFSQRLTKEKSSKMNKDELQLLKMQLNNKDEITLNNELLQKYFAYLTLETYEKYFKQMSKELQSSHADLMIKKGEDEDEIKDFGKAIENTNLVMLYYRKERQLVKQVVQLQLNPYGYKKFPVGCRSLLIGDKVYIIGGKDEVQYYPNVLIYDRKTGKIKRIMDLNEPRAYHTVVYCDVFQTLMVIGGENCSSVEIFDPISNRWASLPDLNTPRANILFNFDKPRGIMYTLFGITGDFIDGQYSSDIEILDLKNIKEGWIRLDYKNKSEADLKTYLSVVEVNNDLMLIYGGRGGRDSMRVVCALNKEKKELTRCDRKLFDKIREETKNKRRINDIVRTLSLN